MEFLRTPDDRFAALPDWPHEPRYVQVGDGLRMHYVDTGPAGPAPVLLLHGEPSWSFLWRHVIGGLADRGLRAVAPDLIGFGRSDKPTPRTEYTYARHVGWVRDLVERLELHDVTLVGQDWGGLIGLRLVAEMDGRFARAVAANTALPTGDSPPPEAFTQWQQFSQAVPELPVGRIVAGGCLTQLAPDVVAAYEAPFPDESYKEGARQFPVLVPTRPDDPAAEANRAAWAVLSRWERPFLCAFSDGDPITRGGDNPMRRLVPGARHDRHVTIEGGGHFLQEDRGAELARVVADFIAATP